MLFHIFVTTIIPILVMVGFGFAMDRKFRLDMPTLSHLNFYIVSPAFMFIYLYEAKYNEESLQVLVFTVLSTLVIGIGCIVLEKLFGFSEAKGGILRNAILFNNCGNIGIPLVSFIYTNTPYLDAMGAPTFLHIAITVQIVILVFQNIVTNSLGFYFAGKGILSTGDAIRVVLRMPIIYTVILGISLNLAQIDIHNWFIWPVVKTFGDALIAVALFTLGVQLARTPFNFFQRDVLVGCFGRLVMAPILTVVCLLAYGYIHTFNNTINQVLLISAAVPSGVTTALIAAAMKNHPEYGTQLVVATTVISSITLPFIILLAHELYG